VGLIGGISALASAFAGLAVCCAGAPAGAPSAPSEWVASSPPSPTELIRMKYFTPGSRSDKVTLWAVVRLSADACFVRSSACVPYSIRELAGTFVVQETVVAPGRVVATASAIIRREGSPE